MPISLACPRCGRVEYASSAMAGKLWHCPACGQSAMVPPDIPAETPVMLPCPRCGSELRVGQQLLGKQVRCNACGMVLTVSGDPRQLLLVGEESVARPANAIPAPPPSSSRATSDGVQREAETASAMVCCDRCGVGLQLGPEHAGKGVRCPKCGYLWVVQEAPAQTTRGGSPAPAAPSPAPPSRSSPKAAAQLGKPCPSCGAPLPPGAILCVACRYNLRTGQQVQGANVESAAFRPCSVCGAMLQPGQRICLKCGISVSATQVSAPRPRPRQARWPYAAGIVALVLTFVVAGVQCVRVLTYDYRQQFAPLLAECRPIAKFSLSVDSAKAREVRVGKCVEGKVLVCEEDGRICDGFTDPDLRSFLPRKASELGSVLFLRKSPAKVQPYVSKSEADAGLDPLKDHKPIAEAYQVFCQICVVNCRLKSVVAEDILVIPAPSQQSLLELAFSGGTGPVATSVADWIQQRLLAPGEVVLPHSPSPAAPPSPLPAEPAATPGPADSPAPIEPAHQPP